MRMKVEIRTYYVQTVTAILEDMGLLPHDSSISQAVHRMEMRYQNDEHYPEMVSWISAAIGCQLIVGFSIERI